MDRSACDLRLFLIARRHHDVRPSQVKGSRAGIRELRPRAGRSPWRALYRRVADAMVTLAVAPEAEYDRRGFDRAVRRAEERLKEIEG